MMTQVTAAALASENKMLSHPASVDSIPTDGNKEDVVPMAMGAAVKLRRSVRNLRHVLAIELIAAAEGLEHRRPLRSSARVEARACARAHGAWPRHRGDRSPSPDIVRAGAMRSPAGCSIPSRRECCHDARLEPQYEPSLRTAQRPAARARAARRERSLPGWEQEAALRMLMNNLDRRGGRASG